VFCLQEGQREQEEKQHKKGSQAAEGERQQRPEEEEEVGTEVEAARGNSVFDAPVPNLAAGVQLGFTPSSAGGPATSLCYIVSLHGLAFAVGRHACDVQPCSSSLQCSLKISRRCPQVSVSRSHFN